jgi:hypothetical protein
LFEMSVSVGLAAGREHDVDRDLGWVAELGVVYVV